MNIQTRQGQKVQVDARVAARAAFERPQSPGEEFANTVSHGVALLAAIAAVPFLIVASIHLGTSHVVGASIFSGAMVLLYLASTLYHALPIGRAKQLMQKLDHSAIYLLIAGSYTPFTLGALNGPWGWTLLALVWSLAALGIALKVLDRLANPWLSTGLYLAMGWLVLIAAVPLVERVAATGIALLVAGGLAYSVGVVFYALDSRVRYAHTVWHGFVAAGTGCHIFAVMLYSA